MDTMLEKRMETFNSYIDRSHMDRKQYQYDGVKWCLNNELRADPPCNVRGGFIADEMGLGKTIMMIGTFLCNYVRKTLVVVPPVLVNQWFTQIYKTTGHKAIIYHGAAKKNITLEQLNNSNIVITTYGAVTLTRDKLKLKSNDLAGYGSLLHQVKWSRVVFDEAHHLRNSRTTRYASCKKLSARIVWLVSGTPIQNSKKDFYSLCSMIRLYASYYADPANLKELVNFFVLKRTKSEVGIRIPDIVLNKEVVGWSNPNEMGLSEGLHSALAFSNVSGSKGDNQIVHNFRSKGLLTLMLRARQSCIYPKMMIKSMDLIDYSCYKDAFDCSSKLDIAVQAIIRRKDNGCGKLVFCHFREEIDEIAKRLVAGGVSKVATFDGRTSTEKRNEILNEKNDVLILQIQTGCEGLNLQENYSEIFFISPHWNPAVEDQAIARCHRIGQTKPVYVQRFEMCKFVKDVDQEVDTMTVDKYVNSVQEVKRSIAKECIDEN